MSFGLSLAVRLGENSDGGPWRTVLSASFTTPGIVTLPSWLSFTCASTRTAEVTPSTVLKGVAVNQAVCNRWGLQHELAAANGCVRSEDFSAWTVSGTPTNNGALLDPTGITSTGADLSTVGANFYYAPNAGLAGNAATVSCWVRDAASPNLATVCCTDGTGNIQIKQAPIAGWQRMSSSGTTTTALTYTEIRDLAGGANARAGYAFCQSETTPFPTSYIPTTTAAVTRALSILKATLPDVSDMKITLSFVASHAPTVVMGAVTIFLGNGANNATYVGYQDSTGKLIVSTPGGQVYSVGVLSWAAGDNVSIDILPRYTSKTTSFVVRVNGVQVLAETLTSVDAPKFDATQVNVGSDYTGTYHLSPKGIVSLSVAVPSTPQPPGSFGTLLAAWDARYNVTKTGNAVTAWTPYLGDASIVLNGTATYVADRGDGKPELSFDGVANNLVCAAANLGTIPLGNYAIVVVCNNVTTPGTRILSLIANHSTGDRALDFYGVSATDLRNQTSYNANYYTQNLFVVNGTKRQALVANRSTTTFRYTSSLAGSVASATFPDAGVSSAITEFYVGTLAGGTPGAFQISSIWLYKSSLNSAEISAALAATHPANFPVL